MKGNIVEIYLTSVVEGTRWLVCKCKEKIYLVISYLLKLRESQYRPTDLLHISYCTLIILIFQWMGILDDLDLVEFRSPEAMGVLTHRYHAQLTVCQREHAYGLR
jgi:hypothetical protein